MSLSFYTAITQPGNTVLSYLTNNISFTEVPEYGFVTINNKNPNSGNPSNENINNQNSLIGFIYVPVLSPPQTSCGNSSAFTIPGNISTIASVPVNYPPVAMFPWTDAACAQAYLYQAKNDGAFGALTFQPSTKIIPAINDASWTLSIADWQSQIPYPVYALSPVDAIPLLTAVAEYSGNLSMAPNGNRLLKLFPANCVARIVVQITLPQTVLTATSIWITVAVILFLAVLIAVSIFFIRRRQRRDFERRLRRGEVNLEALGIKQTNVPQEKIDEMPIYPFKASAKTTKTTFIPKAGAVTSAQINDDSTAQQVQPAEEIFSSSSQPSCPVCLDDFISGETNVRELPCRHIFHPECIDLYLRDTSSLCPVCRKSALPLGYCPVKIDSLMLRRERVLRRVQERGLIHETMIPFPPRAGNARASTARADAPADEPSTAQPDDAPAQAGVEMTTMAADPDSAATRNARYGNVPGIPAEIYALGVTARRAWYREQLARQQQQVFAGASENARIADESRPLWRRVAGSVIPSLT